MNASAYPVSDGIAEYGLPPLLIAASSERAGTRAAETAEQAGYPSITVPIDGAFERLKIQARASAVWIEVEGDEPALDSLLDRLGAEVDSGRFPAVVAAPHCLIDPITARLDRSDIELVIDGS